MSAIAPCGELHICLALFKYAYHCKIAVNAADGFGDDRTALIAYQEQLDPSALQFCHNLRCTADSQLLVSASSVAEDIFKGLLKKDADDKTVMNVSRVTVLLVAVLAYIIAWNPNNTVMGLVSHAWAGLGAAFGPLVVMSLYWKRTNFPGAVAGIVTGALAVIIWDYIPLVGGQTLGKATGLYSLVVGFGLGLIAIIAVSLATKAPSEEMLQEFEDVKANRL